MDNNIYAILVCEKLEQDPKTKFPIYGDHEIVGWYKDKETAFAAVKSNSGDINETCYNYAIIEEVREGLYPCSMKRWFFEYKRDKNEYIQINEPSFMYGFCGLII